jgi:pyrimidine-nucleoside phosphorylase
MIPARLIESKRDGERLPPGELGAFCRAYLKGEVEEYQMAALLMAVYFQGLDGDELDALVSIMIDSGGRMDLGRFSSPRIDKHSTGGVGDTVSLALAPLAAEMGMVVPMMSGRGLGHTGGTLDKLESIPGFRTDLSLEAFDRVLDAVGVGMIGQTPEIAPLDRRLYDLRSVTGTVPAIPLIAASIMSKKLAEDLTGLVLDVKLGQGAFISDPDRSETLARTLVSIGESRGVPTRALLTAMDRPLGRAVGNALEVREALECLSGAGPVDLRSVVVALAGEMACAGQLVEDPEAGSRQAEKILDGGGALERLRRLVEVQEGDPRVVDDPHRLPQAPEVRELTAARTGWVHAVTPTILGYGVVELGGGRTRLGEEIDPAVGFVLEARPGDEVRSGDPLARVHARTPEEAHRGVEILDRAYRLGDGPPDLPPLVAGRITREDLRSARSAR